MVFPDNFLWGGSISAFQAEGANLTDGKGLSLADVRVSEISKRTGILDTSVTADFYYRYKDDIQLMKECGLKSFRFSISWTRIFPAGKGQLNDKGVKFYNDLIDELLANGIEPIVTLFHFDYPKGLYDEYGGFNSRKGIDDFVNYAKTCFELFGDRVKYWLTINEEDVLANIPHFLGFQSTKDSWQAYHHMNIANALIMKLYHEMEYDGKIGPCISYCTVYPATLSPKDQLIAYQIEQIYSFSIIEILTTGKYPVYILNYLEKNGNLFKVEDGDEDLLKGAKPDFLGINWYTTEVVGAYVDGDSFGEYEGPELPRRKRAIPGYVQYYQNPFTKYSNSEWNTDGEGFQLALRKIYERYHLPLIITENGLSQDNEILEDGYIHDQNRIDYLRAMISNMSLAMEAGVEIISYNPWSFIDLLSSSQGINKRYGLVYVDTTNNAEGSLERYKKDSYYWYQKVISSNGVITDND